MEKEMNRNPLLQFAGIPVTASEIKSCLAHLASPEKKLLSMEDKGELLRLKRDLYIVNKDFCGKKTDARLCANHIYGPSYISLQWALRYYGMIPERVFVMTSVTTKRSRFVKTPIGDFSYMHVTPEYFPVGVENMTENGVSFLIAGREKALCDTILCDNFVPDKSARALESYLEDDMRLDLDILPTLDENIVRECAEAGRKVSTLNNLIKIMRQ